MDFCWPHGLADPGLTNQQQKLRRWLRIIKILPRWLRTAAKIEPRPGPSPSLLLILQSPPGEQTNVQNINTNTYSSTNTKKYLKAHQVSKGMLKIQIQIQIHIQAQTQRNIAKHTK